jgi:hypothetical protein
LSEFCSEWLLSANALRRHYEQDPFAQDLFVVCSEGIDLQGLKKNFFFETERICDNSCKKQNKGGYKCYAV